MIPAQSQIVIDVLTDKNSLISQPEEHPVYESGKPSWTPRMNRDNYAETKKPAHRYVKDSEEMNATLDMCDVTPCQTSQVR
jgi:hypothetical protein